MSKYIDKYLLTKDFLYSKMLRFLIILSIFVGMSVQVLAGYSEDGRASWRGARFEGQTTASGERFDSNSYTAAHHQFPFGSQAKVTSKRTGKSVTVTINDRISAGTGRLIDLSKRAAQDIGLTEEGIGMVSIELLSGGDDSTTASSSVLSGDLFQVQYGVFSSYSNAQKLKDRLAKENTRLDVSIVNKYQGDKMLYYVVSSEKYSSQEQAKCHITLFDTESKGVVKSVNGGTVSAEGRILARQSSELYGMTAAHASLPVGQKLTITSEANSQSVIVEIIKNIEKGGAVEYIELSPSAAAEIGLAPNTLEFVTYQEQSFGGNSSSTNTVVAPSDSQYQIQFGSFAKEDNANHLVNTLERKIIPAQVVFYDNAYKVLSKEVYNSKFEAKSFLERNSSISGLVVPALVAGSTNNTSVPVDNNATAEETGEYEYGIQFGAFGGYSNAQQLSNKLSSQGIDNIIYQFPDDEKKLHRVLSSSPFNTKQEALDFLKSNNISLKEASILTFYKD